MWDLDRLGVVPTPLVPGFEDRVSLFNSSGYPGTQIHLLSPSVGIILFVKFHSSQREEHDALQSGKYQIFLGYWVWVWLLIVSLFEGFVYHVMHWGKSTDQMALGSALMELLVGLVLHVEHNFIQNSQDWGVSSRRLRRGWKGRLLGMELSTVGRLSW